MDVKLGIRQENPPSDDVASRNEEQFAPEDPVMKCNSDHETDSKIVVKVEPWWLETETSSDCEDVKDEDSPSIKSRRFCTKAVSSNSSVNLPLFSAKDSGKDASFFNGMDHPECINQEIDVTKIVPGGNIFPSMLFSNYSDGDIYSRALYLKQKDLIHEGKKIHKCEVCEKSFTDLSNLKRHILIHEGKKPHKCKICEKSFTQLSNLKSHNLIHEGKKPHKCDICQHSFTTLSSLKMHRLIHEGKKPHKCKICEKSFTQLSHLKRHNLIHEGKKPHKCEICEKRFTLLSHLKRHKLIHEGKK